MKEIWHIDVCFLINITLHMNELNLKLQGKQKFVCKVVGKVREFKLKLKPLKYK